MLLTAFSFLSSPFSFPSFPSFLIPVLLTGTHFSLRCVTIDRDLVNVSECFSNLTTASLTALCKALGILEMLPDPEMKESFW